MATCNYQTLLTRASTLAAATTPGQWPVLRLSLLMSILQQSNPSFSASESNINVLLGRAQCFECLSGSERKAVRLQLLCEILNAQSSPSTLIPIIPVMTSDTTPSGVASASTVFFTHAAWNAFDRVASDSWNSTGAAPQWIQYQFPTGHVVQKYELQTGTAPINWTFTGSNDGITFIPLDTQINVTNALTSYSISNTTSYSYYRLTQTTGTSAIISLFQMYAPS